MHAEAEAEAERRPYCGCGCYNGLIVVSVLVILYCRGGTEMGGDGGVSHS